MCGIGMRLCCGYAVVSAFLHVACGMSGQPMQQSFLELGRQRGYERIEELEPK